MLGTFFFVLQLHEYSIVGFEITSSINGTIFFVATGFHGIHVIVGRLFIVAVTIRMGNTNINHHCGLEMSLWYWHFVDVVWLFLFTFFYV